MNDPELHISISIGAVILATGVSIWSDLKGFRIPNLLTFPLILSGLAWQTLSPAGLGLGPSVLGALVGFVLILLPFLVGAMGAGDVKLAAGLGAWLGVLPILVVMAVGLSITAVYSIGIVLFQKRGRDLVTALRHSWHCLGNFSEHLLAEDGYESLPAIAERARSGSKEKTRLIPFSIMLGIGLLFGIVAFLGSV